MSTAVDGLIKIGKTFDFESRMKNLESNGYRNVTSLKRQFAIELEDYEEKEILLDDLFAKSRVGTTELFSLDLNKVIQLLSSFEGTIIYPETSKKEVFEEATEVVETGALPEGEYLLESKIKHSDFVAKAKLVIKEGKLVILAGASIAPLSDSANNSVRELRGKMKVKDGILSEDFDECKSVSMASSVVVGHNDNGWKKWKNKDGQLINIYRKKGLDSED